MSIIIENEAYKLYRYVPDCRLLDPDSQFYPPYDIDFSTGLTQRLVRKTVIFRGERTLTQYYDNYTLPTAENPLGTFNELILEVRHTYNRGFNAADPRLAISRSSEIHWMLEDETFSTYFKRADKVYSNLQRQLEEAQIRRHNAVNELAQMVVAAFGPTTSSTDTQTILGWQVVNQELITAWIEMGSGTALIATIPDATDPVWSKLLLNGVSARDQFTDYFTNI